MTESLGLIARIAEEVDVVGDTHFQHRGSGIVEMTGPSPSRFLADFLRLHYFSEDAVAVRALLSDTETRTPLWQEEDGDFIDAVEQANAGRGCMSYGWRFEGLGPGGDTALVSAHDFQITVDSDQLSSHGKPERGTHVDVVFPPFRRYAQRGWYVIFGDTGACPPGADPVLRTYFTPVDTDGVLRLVAALTVGLNERGVNFQIKLRNNPHSYQCLDAFVLYLRAPDWLDHRDVITDAYFAARPLLGKRTPPFVHVLAPGVGVAQAPDHDGAELSFGQHRCLIVAEGLLVAAKNGADTAHSRRAAILDQFRAHGLDPQRPYRSSLPAELDRQVFSPWCSS